MAQANLKDDHTAALKALQRDYREAMIEGDTSEMARIRRQIDIEFGRIGPYDDVAPPWSEKPDVTPPGPRRPDRLRNPAAVQPTPFTFGDLPPADYGVPGDTRMLPPVMGEELPQHGGFDPQYPVLPPVGDMLGLPNYTSIPGISNHGAALKNDPNAPFTIGDTSEFNPTRDAFGFPVSVDETAAERATNNLVKGDRARGGDIAVRDAPKAETKKEHSDEGFGGGFRKKVLDFLGTDPDGGQERLGMSLMGFGSGLLTGGPDIGAAIGKGFAKGADQYVLTKTDQRRAGLADLQIAQAEERMKMERERMDMARDRAARDRTGDGIKSYKEKLDLAAGMFAAGQDPRTSGIDFDGIDLDGLEAVTRRNLTPAQRLDRAAAEMYGKGFNELTPDQQRIAAGIADIDIDFADPGFALGGV